MTNYELPDLCRFLFIMLLVLIALISVFTIIVDIGIVYQSGTLLYFVSGFMILSFITLLVDHFLKNIL